MTVSLVKGGKVDLDKAAGGTLETVKFCLGWDAKDPNNTGAEFDLDASAILLDGNGKVINDSWFIFYGNKSSPNGEVVHSGDNLTGQGDGDDEIITIQLTKLPAEVQKIILAVSIYECDKRGQNFGMVDNSYVRAVDGSNDAELAKYELDMDASAETVLVFAEVLNRNGSWILSANSAGFQEGFAGLLRKYGVNV